MIADRMIFDPRLEAQDVRLFAVLLYYARYRGYSTATNAKLAERLKVSEPTVERCLARLDAAGYLDRRTESGRRRIALRPDGDQAEVPGLGMSVVG